MGPADVARLLDLFDELGCDLDRVPVFAYQPGRFSTAEAIEIIDTAMVKASQRSPKLYDFDLGQLAEHGVNLDALAQRYRIAEGFVGAVVEFFDVLSDVQAMISTGYDVDELNVMLTDDELSTTNLATYFGHILNPHDGASSRKWAA
jgi:hypothetical protein